MKFVIILVVLVISTSGYTQKLPSFIQPCKRSDPQLTSCITKTVQNALPYLANGVPEINFPPIDPLKVDDIKVNQPAIRVQFDEPYIVGLKESRINEVKIVPSDKKIYLNYTKDGSFNGKYKIDGRILIIPIQGEGECKIKFTNLNYFFTLNYDTVKGADGKDHWKILKHQMVYRTDRARYEFDNLFGGNKQLSDAAHKVVNDNWNIIFDDMSAPIMKKISRSVVNVISKFFDNVPVEELFVN